MKKVILLMVVLLSGLVFMAVPDSYNQKTVGFLFSPMRLTLQTWAYFLFEGLTKVFLSWIVLSEAKKYRLPIFIFFWIQVVDLIDYLLTYNSVWFNIGFIPVSMNTIGVTVFSIAVIKSFTDEC